jgi:hypothetical protein
MVNIMACLDAYEDCVVNTYCTRFNVNKDQAIKQIIRLFGVNSLKAMIDDLKRGETQAKEVKD